MKARKQNELRIKDKEKEMLHEIKHQKWKNMTARNKNTIMPFAYDRSSKKIYIRPKTGHKKSQSQFKQSKMTYRKSKSF